MADAIRFRNKTQAASLPVPTSVPTKTYWHETERGFGIRIARPTKSGTIRRSYIARSTKRIEENGVVKFVDDPLVLGTTDELSYEEALDQARAKVRAGREQRKAPPPPKHRLTLGEAFDAYMLASNTTLRPSTRDDYNKRFTSYLTAYRDEPLEDLDTKWWQALYQAKVTAAAKLREDKKLVGRQGDGVTYLKGLLTGCVRALYNHQIELGRDEKLSDAITHNPITSFAKKHKGDTPDPRDTIIPLNRIGDLIQIAQNELRPLPRDVFMCMLLLGWRSTLIYEMHFSRFNAKQRTYSIEKDDCGNKLAKAWEYPLPDYLVDKVFLPRLAAQKEGWVFPSDIGGSGHYSSIHTSLKYLMAKAKISEETGKKEDDHLHPHKIRRTNITVTNTVVPNAIIAKRLASHSVNAAPMDSKMTGQYVISNTESLRPFVNQVTATILGSTANYTRFGAFSLGDIMDSEELQMIREGLIGNAETTSV